MLAAFHYIIIYYTSVQSKAPILVCEEGCVFSPVIVLSLTHSSYVVNQSFEYCTTSTITAVKGKTSVFHCRC